MLDNFHGGEQLSPANAFMSGSSLYDQIFYLRGAGIDAVFPAIGLAILGKSIGSFLLLNEIFVIVAQLSFFTLVGFLIRNPLRYALFLLFFMVCTSTSIFEFRDVFVWMAVALVLVLFKANLTLKQRRLTLFTLGLIASLTLYVSIDRGVVLFGITLLSSALLALFAVDKKNSYTWRPKLWKQSIRNSAVLLLGLFAGVAIPGVLIGWHSFVAFVMLTFIEIPSYGGLLVSQPFPPLFSPTYLIWGPVIITIAVSLLLIQLYRVDIKKNLNVLLPYTYIFVFAAVSIKMGSNRIDVIKMASVTAPLFLITFLILFYSLRLWYKNPRIRPQLAFPLLITLIALIGFSHIDFGRVLKQPVYSRSDLLAYKNLPHTNDLEWITPETNEVRSYIEKHTSKQDYLFAFTSDPLYYYLTDRKNPSRFFLTWYTDPQPYTDELLKDLKKNKPALIIYNEKTWMDAPDSIPIKDRIPEVNAWILANYPNQVQVGNTTILKP